MERLIKMFFVSKDVKIHIIHAKCDCGGEFKCSDDKLFVNLLCHPNNGVEHKCDGCGKVEFLNDVYPKRVESEV